MSLDLSDPAVRAGYIDAQQNPAADLPAGFGETFDVALRSIGEWNSSVAFENARDRALASYYDGVKQQTGVSLPFYGMGGNVSLDELNEAIAKLPQNPAEPERTFTPLSSSDIDAMALERMRKAHDDAAAMSRRETTWGGTLGTVAGTLAAGVSDPIAAATLPLGGAGELGVAARALEFAAIAGGTQAAISGISAPSHEAAVPGSSREIPGEIAGATLFGAVLGGAFGGLTKILGAGSKVLPTSLRDDVNAGTSEAQLAAVNPFPTAAGDGAARDAHLGAVDAMLRGEPVRVADDFDIAHVADYAAATKADTPEMLARAGDDHLRPLTAGEMPDVERFDPVPQASDDAASYWEARLAGASDEERAAMGATDVPEQASAGEPSANGAKSDAVAVPASDLTPEQMTALASDSQTDEAVLRNLDRIRADNPDMEFTVQVPQGDGSYQFATRKLEDVLGDIDAQETLGKELMGCATGLEAAE